MNNMRVKQILHRLFIVVVVFSFICPGNLWPKRKGVQLQIKKSDANVIEGELLQVKENSMLVVATSVNGVTIDINEIDEIKIKKRKTKSGKGALIGAGIGFVAGGAVGSTSFANLLAENANPTLGNRALLGGVSGALCAIPCAILGAAIGGSLRGNWKTKETINVKKIHHSQMGYLLKKLKKMSRFKD